MIIYIFSDIFGKNLNLKEIAKVISKKISTAHKIKIISPYNSNTKDKLNFKSDLEAYDYFIKNSSLENYITKVEKNITSTKNEINYTIGFSMGASALWCNLEGNKFIKKSFLFYSSQIRNYLNITPINKTYLIFPEVEKQFCVDTIIKELEKKSSVICIKTIYKHGFMNKNSIGYNNIGMQEYCNFIAEKINKDMLHY